MSRSAPKIHLWNVLGDAIFSASNLWQPSLVRCHLTHNSWQSSFPCRRRSLQRIILQQLFFVTLFSSLDTSLHLLISGIQSKFKVHLLKNASIYAFCASFIWIFRVTLSKYSFSSKTLCVSTLHLPGNLSNKWLFRMDCACFVWDKTCALADFMVCLYMNLSSF